MIRYFSPLAARGRGLILPALLVFTWWAVARAHVAPPVLLPGPLQVWAAFLSLAGGSLFWSCLGSSLKLVGSGFLLGAAGGLALGAIMGLSPRAEKIVLPLFNAIRQVPVVAWVPLLILWCGVGETARVIFIAIGAAYPVVFNTLAGIRSVPRAYIEVANVFQYSKLRLWTRVLAPAALPSILTGLRLSLAHSWAMVIAAEAFMANVSNGMGNLMVEAGDQFKMDVVMVCVLVIGVIGVVMNQGLRLIESRYVR